MLTETQIQEAANRIVAALKPKKVILFGSYARGDATEHSDLDLMVVAPENYTKRREAMMAGQNAISYLDVGADVVVYSSDDFAERSHWCSNPAYWAIREGKVLYSKSEEKMELFKLACEDYKSCEALVSMNVVNHILFFTAQQTVEKSIKAVISNSGLSFPHTHDLLKLNQLAIKYKIPTPFSVKNLEMLNPFAVESRYFLPNEEFPDAKEALNIAKTAIEWCKEQIHD